MAEFFIFILFVLVIISLVTASNANARLTERVKQLGKTAAEKDNALLERIKAAEAELAILKEQVAGKVAGIPASSARDMNPVTEAEEHPLQSAADSSAPLLHGQPASAVDSDAEEIALQAAAMPPPVAPPKPAAEPKKKRSSVELEALIGGKLLNRVGALAVIFGIGFFLKYAFDNDMIPEWMRVLIGAAAGGLLLFGAMRFHAKGLPVFAQGLAGAGIAALYLSVFASYNFYHLLPQYAAFGLMSGVTIIAFLNALRYNSAGVAALAWAGGFLTPFMLASGQTNVAGLFTYLALLDVGMIALAIFRPKWFLFEPLSFGATWLIWALWMSADYHDADFAFGLFFAVVFWAVFAGAEMYRQIGGVAEFRTVRLFLGGSVAAALYFSLNSTVRFTTELTLLPRSGEHLLAAMLTAAAGVYLLSTILLRRRERATRDYEALAILAGSVLAALAAGHEAREFGRVLAWSGLGVAAVFFAVRLRRNYLALFGIILLGFSFVWLLNIPNAVLFSGAGVYVPLANMRLAGFLALALGFGLAAALLRKQDGTLSAGKFTPLLSAAWSFVAVIALTVEINDYFMAGFAGATFYTPAQTLAEHRLMLTAAMAWMMFSVILGVIGSRSANAALRYVSAGIAGIAIVVAGLACLAYPPEYAPVVNLRTLTLAVCAALAFVNARLHAEALRGLRHGLRAVFLAGGLLLVFHGITVEVWQGLLPDGDSSAIANMWYHRQLALPAVWMALGLIYTGIGAWRKSSVTSYFGLLLAGMATLTGFASAWDFIPVEEHTLLLNYRAGLLLFLAAGAFAAGRYGYLPDAVREKYLPALRIAGGGAALVLLFQLLTVEPWHYFGRLIRMPDSDAELWSNARQLTVSAVWILYSLSLTAAGFLRRQRILRVSAFALFGITILKVFLYDLSFLPTLYRIFSFIGLGVVLLGISYIYQRYKDRLFGAD